MILVALLTGPPLDDATSARLAGDLRLAPYDVRQMLAAGYPAIAQTTLDPAAGEALAQSLRARGWDATAVREEQIVVSEAMVPLDRFTLDASEVRAGAEALPFEDVLCLLRATHRVRTDTETAVRERRFSAGRTLLTGGFSTSTTVTRKVIERDESREQVLYVFRRDARTPWILHESGTRYTGLGPALARTQAENFATTVKLLRERAHGAIYDERLVAHRRVPERAKLQVGATSQTMATSSAWGVDLLANLLAMEIARRAGDGPYRT